MQHLLSMLSRRRTAKTATTVTNENDDDKFQKLQKRSFVRELSVVAVIVIIVTILVLLMVKIYINGRRSSFDLMLMSSSTKAKKTDDDTTAGEATRSQHQEYELYPFLVDATAVKLSSSSSLASSVTKPSFPIIKRLENCTLSFVPANNPPRKDNQQEWRDIFWLPSFPGSGASNPSKKGDLIKEFIEGLSVGDDHNNQYGKPVKDYHMSMRNRLKRCQGISETIGCTNGHPMVPTNAVDHPKNFRPEVIVTIRNPATAIPAFFTYKNIAYHKATKQCSEDSWNNLRDDYFELTLESYFDILKFWRGTSSNNNNNDKQEQQQHYRTVMYVPFEDMVTSDIIKGTTIIRNLSNVLSSGTITTTGKTTKTNNDSKKNGYFETTSSQDIIECIWYRTAKNEWKRQQQIIGDYIPSYTTVQKDMMIKNLTLFANEIESEIQQQQQQYHKQSSGTRSNHTNNVNGIEKENADLVLISLLRRYAYQIEKYV